MFLTWGNIYYTQKQSQLDILIKDACLCLEKQNNNRLEFYKCQFDTKKRAEALNLKGKKLDNYIEQTYECAMKNRSKSSSENLQNQFLKDSITICRCNNLFFEFDDQRDLIMFDGSGLRQLNYEDSLNIHILKHEELRINLLCNKFESQYDKSFLEIEQSKCDSIVFD
jgi:hypothetical protein